MTGMTGYLNQITVGLVEQLMRSGRRRQVCGCYVGTVQWVVGRDRCRCGCVLLLVLVHDCCTVVHIETVAGLMMVVLLMLRLQVLQRWQLMHRMRSHELLVIGIVCHMAVAGLAVAVLDLDQCGGRWLHDGQRNIIRGGGCGRK